MPRILKVVISTKIGAEGINCTDRQNILIADTKEDYINQITGLLADKNRIISIGNNARRLIEKESDNEIIIRDLYGFYAG